MGSSAWRHESWGDWERWPVAVLTWCAAEVCSRYEGRRPEKLGHRRLTAAYGGQSVTMPRRNADDIELRCLLAGRVRRRGVCAGRSKRCKVADISRGAVDRVLYVTTAGVEPNAHDARKAQLNYHFRWSWVALPTYSQQLTDRKHSVKSHKCL